MVPEGWVMRTVGQLFDVQLGKMLSKIAKEKQPQYKYLGNRNVRWDGFKTNDLNEMHFSDREKEKFTLLDGDILMCEGGEVGRCSIWNDAYEKIYYQKALHRLRGKGSISPHYFQQYMQLVSGSKLLEDFTSRTSIAHLTREKLLELPVKCPPLPEQQKIAKILQTWDRAIATTEKLIDASKRQKKALMQQLLTGKKRFSGFERDWTQLKLGDVFEERSETSCDDLPLLAITSEGGVVRRDELGRKDTSNADKGKYKRICPGDIGYNTMRMWQGVSGLSSLEGIISPAYTVVVPTPEVDPVYAAYLFKLPKLVNVFERNSQGLVSDTWNLKFKHFSKIGWEIPSIVEQMKIASTLTNTDKEISAHQKKLNYLKQEKKALMQQLLTGKRRVKVDG